MHGNIRYAPCIIAPYGQYFTTSRHALEEKDLTCFAFRSLHAGLAAFFAASVLAASSAAIAQTKWDMATPFPESNYHTKNARQFVEEVLKESGGQLVITMHSNASLMKMPEIKRAVSGGQVQLGDILLGAYGNEDPFFEIDGIPQLVRSFEEARRLAELTRPFIEARFARQGLTLLYMVPWPYSGFYSQTPIDTLEALRGTRFRTFSVMTNRFATLIGATPTLVQAAELPQAFATGVVNAMVTSATTGVDSSAWDYARVFTPVGFTFTKNAVLMSRRAFDALTPADQATIRRLSTEAETRGWGMAAEAATVNEAILGQRGMNVSQPTPALMQALDRVSTEMVNEWLTRAGEDGARVIAQYRSRA